MEEQLLTHLASTGVVGVLLVLALLALWRKDREVKQEMNARIEDAKRYNELAMSLQKQVIDSVNKQSEIMDRLEARAEAGPHRGT